MMAKAARYNCIDKYEVRVLCKEPLHVGSASGSRGEVLVHPVDGIPFVQASGICGVLRSYCENVCGQKKTNSLFGTHEDDRESRIRFSDGKFETDSNFHMELRPRVKIDPVSGTVSSGKLKGTSNLESGHKFDMEYVGAGAKFSFDIILYGGVQEDNDIIQKCLAALDEGEIQFGGQKSNGCGYVSVLEVKHCHYDMKNVSDRQMWRDETGLLPIRLPELLSSDHQNAYEIEVLAETENELLVKGIAVSKFGKDAPKAENIKNAEGRYIIPGSSFKGSVRSRMEMIAAYMELHEEMITYAFGRASDADQSGMTGNLKFCDVVIDNDRKKKEAAARTRIRIDKFTGGVVHGALFTELNVSGELDMTIRIADKNHPDAVAGLLLLALRDLGYKLFALGGGQNVGKGYVNVKEVIVRDIKNHTECRLDSSFAASDNQNVIERCMKELRESVEMQEVV